MSDEVYDDSTIQPVIDLINAIVATEDEADTTRQRLVDGEVAIIITTDGISIQSVAGKVIDVRDPD